MRLRLIALFFITAAIAGCRSTAAPPKVLKLRTSPATLYKLADSGREDTESCTLNLIVSGALTAPLRGEIAIRANDHVLETVALTFDGLRDRNHLPLPRRRMDVRRYDAALQPPDRDRRAGPSDAAGAAGQAVAKRYRTAVIAISSELASIRRSHVLRAGLMTAWR